MSFGVGVMEKCIAGGAHAPHLTNMEKCTCAHLPELGELEKCIFAALGNKRAMQYKRVGKMKDFGPMSLWVHAGWQEQLKCALFYVCLYTNGYRATPPGRALAAALEAATTSTQSTLALIRMVLLDLQTRKRLAHEMWKGKCRLHPPHLSSSELLQPAP